MPEERAADFGDAYVRSDGPEPVGAKNGIGNYGWIFYTYLGRPAFWLMTALFAAGAFAMTATFGSAHQRAQVEANDIPYTGFGFLFLYYLVFVVSHLKEQIASPRAGLIPTYRVPHLIVAAIMSLPLLVGLPLLAHWVFSLPLFPMFTLNLAFCALVAWAIYQSSWWIFLVIGAWLSTTLQPVHVFLMDFLKGDMGIAPWLVLAGGLCGWALLVRQFLVLSEECPEYMRVFYHAKSWQALKRLGSAPSPIPQSTFQNRWFQWVNGPSDAALARFTHGGPFSLWQRISRRRAVDSNQRLMMVLGPIFLMGTFALLLRQEKAFPDTLEFLIIVLWQALMLPAIAIAGASMRRWPMLGYESLRPLSRREFLLEQGLALAVQIGLSWLRIAVALVLVIALFAPAMLRMNAVWFAICGSLILQFFCLALFVWLLRFRSIWVIAFVTAPIFMVIFATGVISTVKWNMMGRRAALAIIVMVAISGVLLFDAARRWMRTDLG